jgi:hypothetical protein
VFEKKEYTGPIFHRKDKCNPFEVIRIFGEIVEKGGDPRISEIIKKLESTQEE